MEPDYWTTGYFFQLCIRNETKPLRHRRGSPPTDRAVKVVEAHRKKQKNGDQIISQIEHDSGQVGRWRFEIKSHEVREEKPHQIDHAEGPESVA